MRGGPTLHRRAGANPQPQNEADARVSAVPAPYGGWNTRGNLSNMPATDAVIMDNVFPGVQDVKLRKGCAAWTTGFAANVKSLHPYHSATVSRLFASTDAGIFDATSSGAVGAAVSVCTNGLWSSVNYATTGGSFLTMVNGVDNLRLYDGATWTTVTGVSVPAITGLATTSLLHVNVHKRRLWFVGVNSMDLWYLPVDSVAGALTRFPVGSLFRKGGKLVATATWTIDGGNGMDDYLVIATNRGELAVYQGTDPASSATWSLVGVYSVGEPLGRNPFCLFGGELLYLSSTGLYPLSKLAQSTLLDRSAAVSFKIDGAFLDAAEAYATNTAWQMVSFPSGNMLIVNIPTADTPTANQYVMNTISKSWCRFINWNASAWAVMGGELYFSSGTQTYKAWTGTSDAGAPIQGVIMQAYSTLGYGGQKVVTMVRPVVTMNANANIQFGMDTDFYAVGEHSGRDFVNTSSLWDTAVWDTAVWDTTAENSAPKWQVVSNIPGFMHSFHMQITTSTSDFVWTSTNFSYRPAGIL